MGTIDGSLLVTLIEDNYGDVAGGVTPEYIVNRLDQKHTKMYPLVPESVVVWLPIAVNNDPFNKNYTDVFTDLKVRITTKASNTRMKEIVDEVRLIINTIAIAGVHQQWVSGEEDRSDRRGPIHIYDLNIRMITNLADAGTSYSAAGPVPHRHDTHTLEHDGVNSDGGTFAFTTADKVTFNQEVQANKFTLEDGGTFDIFLDEDNMVSDDADAVASQQSIKAYVDAAILTEDTLAEMNDTTIAGLADNHVLTYDNGTSKWINEAQSALTLDGAALATLTTISMIGELDMTGVAATIDLNPASTGSKSIFTIIPTANLVAGSTWAAIYANTASLDPATGAACTVYGLYLLAEGFVSTDNDATIHAFRFNPPVSDHSNMLYHAITEMTTNNTQRAIYSGATLTLSATALYQGIYIDWDSITRDGGAPVLEGVRVQLPANYTNFGTSWAGYFGGDGRGVYLCDTTYALNVSGAMNLAGAITSVTTLATSGNITCGGDLTVTGRDIISGDTQLDFHTSIQEELILTATALRPAADHGLDYGSAAQAIQVVYRESEQTTSFIGVFDDPLSIVKNTLWDESGHLVHTSFPENMRILPIKPEFEKTREDAITRNDGSQIVGKFTGLVEINAKGNEVHEFISDEHYDVDGLAMLTLQAVKTMIDKLEHMEDRLETLEAAS